jgi:uncharacterized repeat protein (TIGR01451 family)
MRKSSLRLIKYVIGFSLALIAVSNCFNVQSSSSSTALQPYDASRTAASKPDSQPSSRISLAAASHGGLFASRRGGKTSALTDLATHASLVSSVASPFTPTITATKSHTPAGNANPGDTLTYTVVIANSGSTDATGVNFTDTIDPNTTLVAGSLIASPIAVDDSYHTIGNVNISVPVAQGVIANDLNPNGSGTLTVTKVNSTPVPGGGSATASTSNGSVTMSSDGSFSYAPNVAFRGPSDSFTYTLDNGTGKTDTATVTISVNGLIWFVNVAAAPGGDGRLSTPFNCLVGPGCFDPVAADIANDNIFVYTGAYTGGLTLLSGQKLIGQGAGDTVLNITGLAAPSGTNMLPSTGGTPPTIAASGTNITLGSGNTIRGVTLNGTAPAAVDLTGTGFGTATIAETALGGLGRALNLNNGTLTGPVASTAAFTSVSSTGSSTTGVSLTTVAGNMSSGSTSITTPAGIGISVSTSSAALNFGTTSSTVSGGTGVSLTSNTGTITFGALTITPVVSQRGLLATENSQTITTAGGSITTSGATAVEITRSSGTTPLAVSLAAVSASSAPNGIKLTNTSGAFTVTGDGGTSNNGSGGTISASTAEGVLISTASNVSLGYLNITNPGTNGIRGTGVNGFTLNRSNLSDNAGNNATDDGVGLSNTSGALSITNSAITNARHQGITIDNNNTNMASLTMSGTSVTGTPGGNGMLIQMRGTSVMTTGTIGGATAALGNTFSTNSATGLQVSNSDTGNIQSLTVQNNTLNGNNAGMDFDLSQNSSMTIKVLSNTLTNHSNNVLNVFSASASGAGTMTATLQNNVIGTSGTNDSGSAFGSGVRVVIQNGKQGAITIDGNQIREVPNSFGIDVEAIGHTSGNSVKVKITNNTLPRPTGTNQNVCGSGNFPCPLSTIFVTSDTDAAAESVCALITGNSAYDPTFFPDGAGSSAFYLARRGPAPQVLNIEGNTSQTPRQNILNNNTVTSLTSPGFGDFTDESGNVTVVALGTCGVFPMSVAPVIEISMKDKNPQPEEELLIGGIEKAGQEQNRELTQAELNWMVQAARARWEQAGISAEDRARFAAVSFDVDHLQTDRLAAISGTHVRIDSKANGFGWYFDPTPDEDSEFDVQVTGKERQASEASPAYGKIDLLTVVMRELGTVYLQGQPRTPRPLRALMESTLAPSVRRMPVFSVIERSSSDVKSRARQSLNAGAATTPSPLKQTVITPIPAVFNSRTGVVSGSYGRNARRMSYGTSSRRVAALSPFSGETVTLNIGTIPPGKSVTIMFQVMINNPLPSGVCSVTNQGHVTGTNFSTVDTNTDVTPIAKPVTIACPANITTNTGPGVCTATVTYTTPTGDGCPTPTVTCNPVSGFAFPKGTTTVTCTATNGNPPDASCTFTVTVNDNQPPTIACPANVIQSTDPGQCSAVVTYANATATDNCPGVGTPVCTPASGSTFAKGTTTVNCAVSDASANSANCSFTVTVNDTTPPTITCPASITQSTDPNQCSAVVTYSNATATDNCPGVGTPVCTPASGSAFAKGTTTVNCTVSDASSNSASCSFTVTVNDTQAPSIACPANVTHGTDANQCSAVVTYSNATATDNCPGVGTPVCTPSSGTTFAKGTTTVNCTVSDASGNPASCSFTVTVNDTQAPSITCPSNVTQGADTNQCSAVVNYSNATATDNCPGVGTPVCAPSSGSIFPKGVTTVTCTVSDASANSASCSFTVTVNDTTPPTITCPANVVHSTDPNLCTAVVTYPNATASDNCPGVGTPVCLPSSGSTLAKGVTTVTCTVSDASGNSASCSFTVTVKDTQAPNLSPCPSNISVTSGGGCQVVTYTPPTATDNCGSATVNCSPASGTCFPPGTTTVTCTASDDSPDSPDSSCSFTVTVVPCTITCPSNIVRGNDPGQCGAVVTYAPTTGGGGCGTVTCSPPSGSFFPVGTTPVNCSTQAGPSCGFTVTIKDTQAPTMTPCPSNVTVTTSGACQVVTYTNPTATDNCGSATVSCSPPSGTCFPVGTTTVTCTASDNSPDSPDTTCSFTVTVIPCANLTALSPAKVWIGLKSSDDEGTNVDLLAEVLKNGSVVGSGQLNNVSSGSSGFNNAILRTITLGLNSATSICPGDTLSFRLSVRVNNAGSSTITVRLWYNGAFIDTGASRDAGSRFDATIGGSNSNYFLRSPGFTLNTTAGSSRTFADKLTSNSGGNPWVAFGTWSKTF